MKPGNIGVALLVMGVSAAVVSILSYVVHLLHPDGRRARWSLLAGRIGYSVTAFSLLGTFAVLAFLIFTRRFEYRYVWEHSAVQMENQWYRFAATWSGQEGSFLLWAAWTSMIGFLTLSKAGRYEPRVMPLFVSVMGVLCAILLKQSPFHLIPPPGAAELAANPEWHYPPLDGQGLTPSLQNYWMTIHPPTIFFGFASLLVPFCYSVAAMLWKDYDGWAPRVMPYALLSCATLGLGLCMGGYWAYETQGWHGFWAWDPVENASFFPWLAVTGLVHGLVAQRSRGGMARSNTFLGILAFGLFLLGTFLTRSGALASKGADGQLLSVHAFDNIGKSALSLMIAMLLFYGGGSLLLWIVRAWRMPRRSTLGDTLLSRDFAFFVAVLLMIVACVVVTLGTTQPLLQGWLHRPPTQPKPSFYNRVMLPISLLAALAIGAVPWLAWRKTNPDVFLKKLLVPWFLMLAFGFFMVLWVQGAERSMQMLHDPDPAGIAETMEAWINPTVQRMAVVALTTLGFLAALSNAMLAFRVLRAKPLSAGGWLAHVGIGIMIIGVVISNTFERTERIIVQQGGKETEAFGYKFSFEKMTGQTKPGWPLNPDFDPTNEIALRVTPPESEAGSPDGQRTFLVSPRWFVHNLNTAPSEDRLERMRWPSIVKYFGHDLYVGLANDAVFLYPSDIDSLSEQGIRMKPKERRRIGPYMLGYFESVVKPQEYFAAHLALLTSDGKILEPQPAIAMRNGTMMPVAATLAELKDEQGNPGTIRLASMNPGTREIRLLINLPGYAGHWAAPLEVTYKPWINLVWLGVIVAVLGTLLAMVRRTLEARRLPDGAAAREPQEEDYELPTASSAAPRQPAGARAVSMPPSARR